MADDAAAGAAAMDSAACSATGLPEEIPVSLAVQLASLPESPGGPQEHPGVCSFPRRVRTLCFASTTSVQVVIIPM